MFSFDLSGGCQGGGAERAAASALRKKAAELVVWHLQSREAMGDGLMVAADKLMATLCASLSLAANGLIRVATGSMGFGDACRLCHRWRPRSAQVAAQAAGCVRAKL